MLSSLRLKGKSGNLYQPPAFSHIYNLATTQMSNDKGTWFGWKVNKVGPQKTQLFTNKRKLETFPKDK